MGAEHGIDPGNDPGPPRGVMSEGQRTRLTGRLVFGAVLVTLGALWTTENLGILDADVILRWWPALLVIFGFTRFSGISGPPRVVSGTLMALAGGWLLARELGFVHGDIFALWPVAMIFIGGSLVWRSTRTPGAGRDSADRHAYPRPFAFMGGISRTIESQELTGLEATAVMGGVEADLRGSRARGAEVLVDVFAWWGGIELVVPEDWRVVSEVTPIMGGVEDSTRVSEGGGATTLVVRGLVVMGGVEIRNDKSPSRFRGAHVGVHGPSAGSRKEVRVDRSGVTVTHDEGPGAPTPL